jgi:hypothetical protein
LDVARRLKNDVENAARKKLGGPEDSKEDVGYRFCRKEISSMI